MNTERLNTQYSQDDKDLQSLNQLNVQKQLLPSKAFNLTGEVFQLINEINNLIKTDLQTENLINQVIQKINKLIQYGGYFIAVYSDNKIIFEKFENSNYRIREYLDSSGVLKLAVEEKRSLIIANPDYDLENPSSNLLIIPVLESIKLYVVFVFEINSERTEVFNRYFQFVELIFTILGQRILNQIIANQNMELKKIIEKEDGLNSIEMNYSTVGKLCLKSFHKLKNKTQIVISSFNLLQKLIPQKDERIEKIFEILNKEAPEFTKTIKSLSELSKVITTNRKPIYIEFEKIIIDLLDFLKLIELSNDVRISILKIPKSKIYGSYELLIQSFLLIFFELNNLKINEIILDTTEDEFRMNVYVRTPVNERNISRDLLEDKSNIKFVRIKKLLKQTSCTFLTKYNNDYFEIMISIPKRSSQFIVKNINYAKNFDSRG